LESFDPWFRSLSLLFLQLSDEAVTAPRDGFNVARPLGRIAKHVTKLFYGCIQAIVRVHEGTRRPQLFLQLLAGDDLSPSFHQQQQDFKRLVLEAHSEAILPQFAGARVHLEAVEPQGRTVLSAGCHLSPQMQQWGPERILASEVVSNSVARIRLAWGILGYPPWRAQV
jgi:hypothetical protein